MKLMHYTAEPLTLDSDRTYEEREPSSYGKPKGFWVSIPGEYDWPSWCHDEECFIDSLSFAHEVTLAPGANIHLITSRADLKAFTDRYTVQTDWERKFSWMVDDRTQWPIDWHQVAADYDGVIIAPYQWQRRLEVQWYYGWDCASGCIWNLDAIASVQRVEVAA